MSERTRDQEIGAALQAGRVLGFLSGLFNRMLMFKSALESGGFVRRVQD